MRMLPAGCQEFEYDALTGARSVLQGRLKHVLCFLQADPELCKLAACQTRPAHALLYYGLTPLGHDYYAGHFRGEPYRCLKNYEVAIRDDPAVGFPAAEVLDEMSRFERSVAAAIAALDAYAVSGRSRASLLIRIAQAAAVLFELFLRIHPYANGNGHIARLIVCAVMGRYRLWPRQWSVEPRPVDWARFLEALKRQRHAGTDDLAKAFLAMAKWG